MTAGAYVQALKLQKPNVVPILSIDEESYRITGRCLQLADDWCALLRSDSHPRSDDWRGELTRYCARKSDTQKRAGETEANEPPVERLGDESQNASKSVEPERCHEISEPLSCRSSKLDYLKAFLAFKQSERVRADEIAQTCVRESTKRSPCTQLRLNSEREKGDQLQVR